MAMHHGFLRSRPSPVNPKAQPLQYARLRPSLSSNSNRSGSPCFLRQLKGKPTIVDNANFCKLHCKTVHLWFPSVVFSFLVNYPCCAMFNCCMGEKCLHVMEIHASAPGTFSNCAMACLTCSASQRSRTVLVK